MRRLALLVPVFASLAAFTPASLVHAQGSPFGATPTATAPQETTLSVNGIGKVERVPDYLDVTVGIMEDQSTAAEAQAAAEAIMAKLVADVRALSLAGMELQTGTVSLEPRYEQRDRYDAIPKIVGYRAAISIRVRTTDLPSASKIIDTSLNAGANQVQSVTFGIKEALEAREEAITLAGKAAKRKAATLASALDLKLGRVITASSFAQQTPWYPMNRMSNLAQAASSTEGSADGEAVVPGKIEITAEVSVTYAADAAE